MYVNGQTHLITGIQILEEALLRIGLQLDHVSAHPCFGEKAHEEQQNACQQRRHRCRPPSTHRAVYV